MKIQYSQHASVMRKHGGLIKIWGSVLGKEVYKQSLESPWGNLAWDVKDG